MMEAFRTRLPTLFPTVFSIMFAIVIYYQVAHSVACELLGGRFRDCVYLVWHSSL